MILHIAHHHIPYNKINAKKPQAIYIFQILRKKMTRIWPKRAIFEFSPQKSENVIFLLQRLGLLQTRDLARSLDFQPFFLN